MFWDVVVMLAWGLLCGTFAYLAGRSRGRYERLETINHYQTMMEARAYKSLVNTRIDTIEGRN